MKRHDARRRLTGTRLAVAVGIAALLAPVAARAQAPRPPSATGPLGANRQTDPQSEGFRFNGRFRDFNPQGRYPAPVVPGLPGGRYLGPGVQETYPYTPFQQPDILRNYLQMRSTSPRPDAFLGGQFNPQYRSTGQRPPQRGGHYYGGYVEPYGAPIGYGGYAYGGYAFSPVVGGAMLPSIYSSYGSWYPPYLPQERVILQREIIYVQPEARREAPEARTEPSTPSEPAAGEYYLSRSQAETLQGALQDVRRAWLNGDYGRFRARVKEDGRVRIFLKGKYQYAVGGDDFGQMTRDAMTRIDTTSFELDRVNNIGEDRAFASGKHTYLDPEQNKREVYVSYGLARENGRWLITEAGSSTTPIERHAE